MKHSDVVSCVKKIQKLLDEDKTIKEVSDELNLQYRQILYFIKKYELKPKSKYVHRNKCVVKNELRRKIENELQNGELNQNKIAAKYGVSRQYVSHVKGRMNENK